MKQRRAITADLLQHRARMFLRKRDRAKRKGAYGPYTGPLPHQGKRERARHVHQREARAA